MILSWLVWVLRTESGPLQEHPVLITAESSLRQVSHLCFMGKTKTLYNLILPGVDITS